MKAPQAPGPLLVIGGAEDKKGACRVLDAFVRLAGGARTRLVVMTVASQQPVEVGAEYVAVFQRLGVKKVDALHIEEREQANTRRVVEAVEQATAVFFTGGDQVRITNLLGGTKTDQV